MIIAVTCTHNLSSSLDIRRSFCCQTKNNSKTILKSLINSHKNCHNNSKVIGHNKTSYYLLWRVWVSHSRVLAPVKFSQNLKCFVWTSTSVTSSYLNKLTCKIFRDLSWLVCFLCKTNFLKLSPLIWKK